MPAVGLPGRGEPGQVHVPGRELAGAGQPGQWALQRHTVECALYQVRAQARVEARFLRDDHLLHPGEYAWDDEAVPAGRPLVVVNLKAQLLSVYRSGYEIGRARIIYGADNMPTPTGTFPILQKDADHVSNLYDAPMPFMLRLTMDGISIHASKIAANYATHGCIGLPKEFAEVLFANVKVGDKVVVWAG